jgi:cell fate regulator YaaT (PSP1 superfamily)
MTQSLEQQRTVAGVRFQRVGKLYHFEYDDYPQLQKGDHVIVETTRGRQMGEVVNFYAVDEENRDYKPILRMASPRDLILRHHWELQQDDAMEVVKQKVREHNLRDAKFVTALYNFDGTLLTIVYTADDKVNVNKLWSDLSKVFPHATVELRQVGPRDVAKLLGGFGACGELRCCSTFLTDFSPVSIKMAKAQGISLNPSEITGMCGRLRCCLVYEYEQYVEARQHLPKKNKRIGTPHGEGRVIDVMPLQDAVLVAVGDGMQVVKREEIVPLEELEAMAKKAKEPCDKHEGGGCDCGAQDGKPADAQASAEAEDLPLAQDWAQSADAEQDGESPEEDE